MLEIWKQIKDYPNYEVSNLGRVKSIERYAENNGGLQHLSEKILKIESNIYRRGYCQVHLSKDGKVSTKKVHRLVAEAFIPNPNNLPQVNHKDTNPLNNCVDNLEWCNQQYNNDYSISKRVLQYDLKGDLLNSYDSTVKAGEAVGIDPSNICRCCNGKTKTSKGYVWKYA